MVDIPERRPQQSLRDRLLRRFIGTPGDFIDRVIALVIIVCAAILTAALYFALARGVDPRATSSYPYLRPLFWLIFNEWLYVVVFALVARRLLLYKDTLKAHVAADKTGFESKTIQRLAEEAKSATGGTVVLVESDDSHQEICDRIDRKLEGEGDDSFVDLHEKIAPAPLPPGDEDLSREAEILDEVDAINEELEDLYERADTLQDEVLDASISPARLFGADEDRVSLYDLMDDEAREDVEEFEALIEEIERLEDKRVELLDEYDELIEAEPEPLEDGAAGADAEPVSSAPEERVSAVRRAFGTLNARLPIPVQYALGMALGALSFGGAVVGAEMWRGLASLLYYDAAVVFLVALLVGVAAGVTAVWLARGHARSRDVSETADGAGPDESDDAGASPAESTSDVDDGSEDPYAQDLWRRHWQETKLKLKTHLSVPEIAWNVGIPALTIFGALIIAGGIWVQWWAALGALALGLLVGLLNWRRVHAQRERKLKKYRQGFEPEEDNLIGFQVKHVETPDAERFYAYFPRHTYATDNRDEFLIEVAQRAYEAANGLSMSPSILEKYARQDREMLPNLDDFHDQELGDIMWWLLEEVSNAEIGIVCKQKLIEDCVEHDVDQRWHQRYRSGYGYDPRLVRQAYRLLVDCEFLYEEEVVLDATDEDGDPLVSTGVCQRYDPVPVETSQIRAEFTTEFRNYAQWEPLYEMPDVDDLLDRPPMLSDRAGPAASPLDEDLVDADRTPTGAAQRGESTAD